MGFLEDITTYVWNWVVYTKHAAALVGCFNVGGWGLLFDDDDGAMMLFCMELFGGATVTYPAYYMSSYSEEA